MDMFEDFYLGQEFSYCEIQAWQKTTGIELDVIELEIIRQLCLEKEAFFSRRSKAHYDALKSQTGKGAPKSRRK